MTDRTRETLDPLKPWQFFAEQERTNAGEIAAVNTIFLTNRECPWHCVVCDLWKNTLTENVPIGAIPRQIEYALERLPRAAVLKLYNSGSFFDPRAIPLVDYAPIAHLVSGFDRVVVESHPALIGERCIRLRDLIPGRLEVAMGLETVDTKVLPKLNKGMTLERFSASAEFLRDNGMDLRAFILVKPPFQDERKALFWAQRSLDFAFLCGATAATLIPTRGGNPALDNLAAVGDFAPPRIRTLEASQEYGIGLKKDRVFADLWDLAKFKVCDGCYRARCERLNQMNLHQTIPIPVKCTVCGDGQ